MASTRRRFVRSIAGASMLSLADPRANGNTIAKNSIPLAVPGKPPYSMFLSSEASPPERWAAEELRGHIQQMTGIELRIEAGASVPGSPRVIAIGRSGLTERLGISPPEGESSVLKTSGETVVIAGGRKRGTMYGVSILLEKLGCRWFTPDVARIPKAEALWLPELNEIHEPGFQYREVFFTEAQGREWSARNRLNGNFHKLDDSIGGKITYLPWAHSFYDLVPPERYFAGHPEYFALVDGRRREQGAQLCLTNAEVLRLVAAQVEEWLGEHPDVGVISVSQNDTDGWCECDPCRQVIEEEGGAISGLALRFVNQVADRINASHPGKLIDMLAYQDTADPPSMARPRSNVQIRLCPIDACQAHSYKSCSYNKRFRQRLEQWSRIAPKLLIWQYSVNFSHYLAPFPNYDALIADIPLFRNAGISGLFLQGAVSDGGGGDDAELRSYLAARLLWKPDLDASAEIRGFLDAVYGPAAPILWSYFVLRQQEVRRGRHLWIDQNLFDQKPFDQKPFDQKMDARDLTPDFLKRGRALLEQALPKVATNAARRRIERHLLSIDYVEAMRDKRCVIQGEGTEGMAYGPADPARARDETRKLVKTSGALGITNLREGYPLAQQARDWGDVGARYGAVVLADGAAKATVIPELGRVVEFGGVLRVPDPGEWAYPHKGGIYASLSDGDGGFQLVEWKLAATAKESVTLTGKSEFGRDLRMEIAMVQSSLRVRVAVSNPSAAPARVAILCRAELWSSPEATLTYRERTGNQRSQKIGVHGGSVDGGATFRKGGLPQQEWALAWEHPPARVRNRFRAEEVEQCAMRWSFRDEGGLSLTMNVVSPRVELGPGQQLSLTSEYDLMGNSKAPLKSD